MSIGRFLYRMMAVVLCLMMQLPLLTMPVAMASAGDGAGMAGMAGAPMMAASLHGMTQPGAGPQRMSPHRMTGPHDTARQPAGSTGPGQGVWPDMGAGMQDASSHAMALTLVRVHAPSWGMRMGDSEAPCCQSHHASCYAGVLPAGPCPALPLGSRLAFLHHALRLSLRSSIVPPWRPPAILPV